MVKLNIIVPKNAIRDWHIKVADKLAQQGHDIEIIVGLAEKQSFLLNSILWLDMRLFGVHRENCFRPQYFDPQMVSIVKKISPDALVLDLTGEATGLPNGALHFKITNDTISSKTITKRQSFYQLANMIAAGILPNLSIRQNGKIIADAKPMIDNRFSISRGLQDVLDRAVSFIVATIDKKIMGVLTPVTATIENKPLYSTPSFFFTYITKALPRLGAEIMRRRKYHSAHWRVGYRFKKESPKESGVVQTGDLSGEKWLILPDDNTHFYADPFPFMHKNKAYIFVEDWCHQQRKAVISMSSIGSDGLATIPIPIIEEAWHLSYPQVFAHQEDIWMLPESSEARNLRLYRAKNFPEKWEKHTTLIEDRDLSDATLLEHDGKFWLFATESDEGGSRSDMLVVFYAQHLEGPWIAHQSNPIIIDRAGARPGGAFIRFKDKIFLPIQDGTLTYGGGLGLSELTKLNEQIVSLSPALAINNKSEWPYPKIHTLNASESLEVIDGIAAVEKTNF